MKPFTTSLKFSIPLQSCNLYFQNVHNHFAEFQFNLICVLLWRIINAKKASERASHYWSLSTECLKCFGRY